MDPANKFQTKVRKVIKESNCSIPQAEKWRYINLNPTAPTIKGLIKIHKPQHPIRPIVNWKNAPAYKLAKLFSDKLKVVAPLPFTFNVKNTLHLIDDLKEIPISTNVRIASLDITNMYTNIPVTQKNTFWKTY